MDHKARELLLLSAAELKASLVLGSNPASGGAAQLALLWISAPLHHSGWHARAPSMRETLSFLLPSNQGLEPRASSTLPAAPLPPAPTAHLYIRSLQEREAERAAPSAGRHAARHALPCGPGSIAPAAAGGSWRRRCRPADPGGDVDKCGGRGEGAVVPAAHSGQVSCRLLGCVQILLAMANAGFAVWHFQASGTHHGKQTRPALLVLMARCPAKQGVSCASLQVLNDCPTAEQRTCYACLGRLRSRLSCAACTMPVCVCYY